MGKKLEVEHPLFSWLVEHCADLITKYQVGKEDGLTPHQRLKGH